MVLAEVEVVGNDSRTLQDGSSFIAGECCSRHDVLNSGDANPLAGASDDSLVWFIHAGRVLLRPLPRPLPIVGDGRDVVVENDRQVDDDELDKSSSNDFSSYNIN